MAKCDFQIVFDRQDRTYRPGEEVRGTIHLQAQREFSCSRLVVESCWKAHGRGNTERGVLDSIELPAAAFQAEQILEIPFRFTAPDGPPTYHGTYLNVDQYIRVFADVSWAIDPKHEEDYVLLPGNRDWGNRPDTTVASVKAAKGSPIATVIAVLLIIVGIMSFFFCGFLLVILGCVILLANLRKSIAEKKLGQVDVRWGSLQVAPGGSVPLRLSLAPRRTVALNAIRATLWAREKCVSGSGTDKTTHVHVVHQQVVEIAPEGRLAAGEPATYAAELPIPLTDAYSFHASDNDLVWSIEMRIDIPKWPDWVEEVTLLVRPSHQTVNTEKPLDVEVLPPLPVAVQPAEEVVDSPPTPVWPEAAPEPPRPTASEPPSGAPPMEPGLAELVRQLAEAPRYGPEREQVVAARLGESFDCAIELSGVERTFGSVPEPFRNGRTLVGVVAGTDCKVALQLPAARNQDAEGLSSGKVFRGRATLIKWNIIYDRLEMREAEVG
jgi:hypothetical protein